MNTKLKPPCWVKHKQTGAVLRCRSISRPNARMKRETGWQGLVLHVQNEKGTGIMQYRDAVVPTAEDLAMFNERVARAFGVPLKT